VANRKDKPVFYGGQAVIEGVMMRGPKHVAVSVRRADGRIETTVKPAVPWLTLHPAFNKVFVRGVFALVDSMRVGVWGLRWSANKAMMDASPTAQESRAVDAAAETGATNFSTVPGAGENTVKGTMGLGLVLGIGLFIVLPTLVTGWFKPHFSAFGLNVIEGVIRLALFFGYISLVAKLEGIHRVFQYHGAEHRTINAFEAGAPLTPEGVRPFSVIHPRCGTSFMIFVLILCTVVYTFFGWHPPLVRLIIRLGLLPIVAGFAYELLRLAGRFRGNTLLNVITWPGRFSQRFTTREPDDRMAEVAIAALDAVFDAERAESPEAVPTLA
jgi:uncharacterized protein YqhQ